MPATLTADSLKKLIKSGEIDTVLVCFPDMQGRLIGKRVTGRYFLDKGIDEAACLRLPARRRHGYGAGARIQGSPRGIPATATSR